MAGQSSGLHRPGAQRLVGLTGRGKARGVFPV